MVIIFEELGKKEKSRILKGIENTNQILKNIFETVYINHEGVCYNNESMLQNGRCVCNTDLNGFIVIKENQLLKLDTKTMYECIKAGKTKINGYSTDDNKLIFHTSEKDFLVGEFIDDEKLNLFNINSIIENETIKENRNDLLERFDKKEFVEFDIDKYKMFVTHKLFPSINKSKKLDVVVHDNNDGTFYTSFVSRIEERNKNDELTFSMGVEYIYKFILV